MLVIKCTSPSCRRSRPSPRRYDGTNDIFASSEMPPALAPGLHRALLAGVADGGGAELEVDFDYMEHTPKNPTGTGTGTGTVVLGSTMPETN